MQITKLGVWVSLLKRINSSECSNLRIIFKIKQNKNETFCYITLIIIMWPSPIYSHYHNLLITMCMMCMHFVFCTVNRSLNGYNVKKKVHKQFKTIPSDLVLKKCCASCFDIHLLKHMHIKPIYQLPVLKNLWKKAYWKKETYKTCRAKKKSITGLDNKGCMFLKFWSTEFPLNSMPIMQNQTSS